MSKSQKSLWAKTKTSQLHPLAKENQPKFLMIFNLDKTSNDSVDNIMKKLVQGYFDRTSLASYV